MLIKGIRQLALVLIPVLSFALILFIYYAGFQPSLPSLNIGNEADGADDPLDDDNLKAQHASTGLPLVSSFPSKGSDIRRTHNEVFSVSTRDKRYFDVDFGEMAMNPSIIPHPVLKDTWIIVAQQAKSEHQPKSLWFSELVCDARFKNGRLACIKPPKILPISATTSGDKCVGDIDYFAMNIGPHDARVFHGPDSPYVVYGSNSWYTCFGQWIQDFRMLVDWGDFEVGDGSLAKRFRLGTELQRPGPWGLMEKNWFLFWDSEGAAYVHYDVHPKRVFAKLTSNDGSATVQDLAPVAAARGDESCLAKYMPSIAPELESIHQATNSLSITLCQRADVSCQVSDSNTYIFTIFQHKNFYGFHSVYEPYAMLFKRTAPFELFGISSKPIWIHGRKEVASPEQHPRRSWFDGSSESDQPEMFYVTSMSWKAADQNYHGYVDDVLFVGFGIEDQRTAGIDVVAGDLLRDMGLCSDA